MVDVTAPPNRTPGRAPDRIGSAAMPSAWSQLKSNRHWLGYWFMLPALAILVLFLAYPLALGVWLSFTDTKLRRG
ncbi:MAG: sugar ABC transporter permease, partial [Rhizobiales bacterium]|nr:sugar ABC transporter permease [Hyphomicrobiales bacterium]